MSPARAADTVTVEVEGRRLQLGNLSKVFYPEAGFTKRDVVDELRRIERSGDLFSPVLSLRQRLPTPERAERPPAP